MNALHKSEGPLAGGPIAEKSTGDDAIVVGTDAERKRRDTLTAMLALHGGHVVTVMPSGEYLVSLRGVSTFVADVDALELFARRVGAVR